MKNPANFKPLYDLDLTINEKIETVAREIYGADGVAVTPQAQKAIDEITALGFGKLPICVAKTQYSLSDDASKLGRPSGFTITIRDVKSIRWGRICCCLYRQYHDNARVAKKAGSTLY